MISKLAGQLPGAALHQVPAAPHQKLIRASLKRPFACTFNFGSQPELLCPILAFHFVAMIIPASMDQARGGGTQDQSEA